MTEEVKKAEEKKDPNVIDVEKSADWTPAVEVKERCWIPTANGDKQFDVRAISYQEETKIYEQIPEPDVPMIKRRGQNIRNPEDPVYQKSQAKTRFSRNALIVDKSWMEIPGETAEEKVEWFEKNMLREGELLNLVNEINEVSGYRNMMESDEEDHEEEPMLMATPEEWASTTQKAVFFKIKRGEKILRFKLNGISGEKTKEIEVSCDPGNPPLEPIKGVDGRVSNQPMPNPNNPRYMRKKRQMEQIQRVLFIESALPFDFPGETMEQKLEWLGQRPAGEVVNLYRFVRVENLSYKDKTDFTLGL